MRSPRAQVSAHHRLVARLTVRATTTVAFAAFASCIAAERAHAAPVTLDGVVRTEIADPAPGPTGLSGAREEAQVRQLLETSTETYVLRGAKLKANARVRIKGDLRADRIVDVSPVRTLAPTVAELAAVGTTRVLVMLAYWTAPDTVTPELARDLFFSEGNAWYREASYGALGQTGDVTPWLAIEGPATDCYAEGPALMERAKAAAAARGYVLASYDNFVLYFPRCVGGSITPAGWAFLGAPNAWLNGGLNRGLIAHEQGHNYGLLHSHSYLCSNGGLQGACTFAEYGDVYDTMGYTTFGAHYSASQKNRLAWLTDRVVDLSGGGRATIAPMSSAAAAPRAVTVSSPAGVRYWLEYRQATGFDANLPGGATDGVLVHATGPGSGSPDTGPALIDVRPADGISVATATLRAGQRWTTDDRRVTFTVEAADPLGATVSVALAAPNLVSNPSFETGTTGWGSYQGTLSRVALGDAPDGAYVARAARSTSTLYSISDEQGGARSTVSSTVANSTYVATGFIKAATPTAVGKSMQIFLRERTPSGAIVRDTSVSAPLTSTFTRIAVAATATAGGNTMGLRIVQNGAVAGDAFYADQLTVRPVAPVLGKTDAGTVWTAATPQAKRASPFTFSAPATADLASITAYLDGRAATSGSQPVRAVLYADAGGVPGALVARTNERSIAAGRAAGWVTFDFASPVRVPSGRYWLGLHSGGTAAVARYAASAVTNTLRFNDDSYGDGSSANPFGTANLDAKYASIYASGA